MKLQAQKPNPEETVPEDQNKTFEQPENQQTAVEGGEQYHLSARVQASETPEPKIALEGEMREKFLDHCKGELANLVNQQRQQEAIAQQARQQITNAEATIRVILGAAQEVFAMAQACGIRKDELDLSPKNSSPSAQQ